MPENKKPLNYGVVIFFAAIFRLIRRWHLYYGLGAEFRGIHTRVSAPTIRYPQRIESRYDLLLL